MLRHCGIQSLKVHGARRTGQGVSFFLCFGCAPCTLCLAPSMRLASDAFPGIRNSLKSFSCPDSENRRSNTEIPVHDRSLLWGRSGGRVSSRVWPRRAGLHWEEDGPAQIRKQRRLSGHGGWVCQVLCGSQFPAFQRCRVCGCILRPPTSGRLLPGWFQRIRW